MFRLKPLNNDFKATKLRQNFYQINKEIERQ